MFNFLNKKNPITTILRKTKFKVSKYYIIPFNSNVSLKYKKNDGFRIFLNNQNICSAEEEKQQTITVKTFLSEK